MAEIMLDISPRTMMVPGYYHRERDAFNHGSENILDLMVEKINYQPHEQDNLDNPNRNACYLHNVEGRGQRFGNYLDIPSGWVIGDNYETGEGQCSSPAEEEKNFQVALDTFDPEREDEDENKDDQQPKVCQDVHENHHVPIKIKPNWFLISDLWSRGLNEFLFLEKMKTPASLSRYSPVPSRFLEETIYKVIRYRPINIKRWLSGKMAKDMTKTINALRCIAVERCRERLDQAARRAKVLLKNRNRGEQKEDTPSDEEQYGVTSLMKRRHGL